MGGKSSQVITLLKQLWIIIAIYYEIKIVIFSKTKVNLEVKEDCKKRETDTKRIVFVLSYKIITKVFIEKTIIVKIKVKKEIKVILSYPNIIEHCWNWIEVKGDKVQQRES